jgi:hypothetical protein
MGLEHRCLKVWNLRIYPGICMYEYLKLTFYVDNVKNHHKITDAIKNKIRYVASKYGCVNTGSSGLVSDKVHMYYTVPHTNVNVFSNQVARSHKIKVETYELKQYNSCMSYFFCQEPLYSNVKYTDTYEVNVYVRRY